VSVPDFRQYKWRIKNGLEIFNGEMEIKNPKTKGMDIMIEIPVGKRG